MDAQAVIDHYESKGYKVTHNARVRDDMGNIHHVDLLVQSRLGSLVVALEDEGGFEGPELGHIKRLGRDLKATPVAAATTITPLMRRMATRMGVVILDANTLTHEAPTKRTIKESKAPEADEPSIPAWPGTKKEKQHEWPASGRARPIVETELEPVEVEDLMAFWSPDRLKEEPLHERVLEGQGKGGDESAGLWRKVRGDDEERWTKDAPKPQATTAGPKHAPGFSWLQAQSDAAEAHAMDHAAPGGPARDDKGNVVTVRPPGAKPAAGHASLEAGQADLRDTESADMEDEASNADQEGAPSADRTLQRFVLVLWSIVGLFILFLLAAALL